MLSVADFRIVCIYIERYIYRERDIYSQHTISKTGQVFPPKKYRLLMYSHLICQKHTGPNYAKNLAEGCASHVSVFTFLSFAFISVEIYDAIFSSFFFF